MSYVEPVQRDGDPHLLNKINGSTLVRFYIGGKISLERCGWSSTCTPKDVGTWVCLVSPLLWCQDSICFLSVLTAWLRHISFPIWTHKNHNFTLSPGNKQSQLLTLFITAHFFLPVFSWLCCFCWDQDSGTGSWFIQPHSFMRFITLFPSLSPEPQTPPVSPFRAPLGLAQFSHRAHLKWDCVFWFPRIISSHISYSERGSIIPPVMDDAFTWFTPSRVPTSHGQCLHTHLHPWPTPSELNILKPACLCCHSFFPCASQLWHLLPHSDWQCGARSVGATSLHVSLETS